MIVFVVSRRRFVCVLRWSGLLRRCLSGGFGRRMRSGGRLRCCG